MATTTKEILAKLRLDSKEFVGKLDESHKSILKVTAGLTAVSAAVVAATKMTANYRDETVKAARAAGSTAEDFSALKYAADLSGVSMEQLTKGLRQLNDPSKAAQAEMAGLGISMVNSSGQMKTQNEILYEVADAIKGIESPAQKSAAAVKIFGEKGSSMVNLLAGGSEGLRTMTTEAERMGLVFDTKAGEAAELFNDNITRLTSSVKGMVMSFADGIIELVNATGIMETLSGAVQAVTGWWRSLDESTRSMITTVGAVVAGVAALVLILAGVIAIAPAVTAAVTAMTGGINLIVLGIAAAIAAFVAIAVAAAKYWDQVKQAIMPAVDMLKETFNSIVDSLQPIIDLFSGIFSAIGKFIGGIVDKVKSWLGITGETTGSISILGTIAKAVFAGIGAAVMIVILPFKTLWNIIYGLVSAIANLGKAAYYALTGDFKKAGQSAKDALGSLTDMGTKIKNDFVKTGDSIKKSFSGIVVKVDTKKAKQDLKGVGSEANRIAGEAGDAIGKVAKQISNLASDVSGYFGKYVTGIAGLGKIVFDIAGQIGKNLEVLGDKSSTMAEKTAAVFSMIGNVASKLGDMIIDAIATPIQTSLARMTRYMEIYTGLYTNQMEALIEATEKAEDEKLAILEAKYDAQIAALEDAERRKTSAVEFAANERLLAMDAEYQAAREKAEEEYALWVEQEEIRYETEKEMMLRKAIDKEQAMLVEEVMDNDFKNYLANRQAAHNTIMEQLAASYATRTKGEQDALKAELEASETASNATIKALTEQKNADLEAAEEAKNAKMTKLEEEKQKKEKLLKKAQILMSWKAEQSEFRATQGAKIAQTMVSGIAGAAMGFATMASLGIVGLIIGAVVAATVMAMTIASVAQMAMQQPPSAPAALFLATGGVLSGPSHAMGGISTTMEGGEGVLDRVRTEKFIEAADRATGSSGLNVYFEQGSIVNNGKEVDDSFIDTIAGALARKLERQGVYA